MRAAAEAATRAGASPRRHEANERYLRARTALVDRMARLAAELSVERSAPRWTSRLFFLDLDGVFDWAYLGFPHTTPCGVAALALLKAHGFSVVLNTGRSLEDVRRYCAIYGLPGGLAEHGSVFFDAVRHRNVPLIDRDGAARLARCRALIVGLPGACIDPAYADSVRVYRYAGRRTCGVGGGELARVMDSTDC